ERGRIQRRRYRGRACAASAAESASRQAGIGDDAELALREIDPVEVKVDGVGPRHECAPRRVAYPSTESYGLLLLGHALDVIDAAALRARVPPASPSIRQRLFPTPLALWPRDPLRQ